MRLLQFLLLLVSGIIVYGLVTTILPPEPPRHASGLKSEHLREEGLVPPGHPGMREIFYLQRLYGSEDINIQQKLFDEFQQIQERESFALHKATATNPWTEQGPWNIGGRIRGLAFDPVNTNTLYAAAASGGVWKSTNLGADWKPVADAMPTLASGAIAVDRNNPNIVFAGTGEPDAFSNTNTSGRGNGTPIYSTSVGILKSEDYGETWSVLPFQGFVGGVHRIAISPVHHDTMLVATTTGLLKTTNGGQSWQTDINGVFTDVLYRPGSSSKIYAAYGDDRGSMSSGVYASNAGGGRFKWGRLTNNFPAPDSCGRIVMAISPANPDRIYVAIALSRARLTNQDNDFFMLVISNDGGNTWERKANVLSPGITSGQAYYDFCIAVSPSDANTLFIGGLDVWRSTNGGNTFAKMSDGNQNEDNPKYVHVDIHSFAFKPDNGNALMVGCDGGISYTTDAGQTWQRKVNKLGTVQYYAINYDPSNPANLFGGTQDNGTHAKFSSDNAQWNRFFGGDGGNVTVDPTSNSIRYVTSLNIVSGQFVRPVVRYTFSGSTPFTSGLNAGAQADRFNWLPPVYLHPNDRTRLYTASQYVYAIRNPHTGSPPWSIISPEVAPFGGIVTDLAISEKNGDWMYAISNRGDAYLTKNVLSLEPTWQRVSNGLPTRWLTDVTFDWDNPDIAYVSASGFGAGHAFKTTNAGQSWTDISGDLPDIPASAIIRSRTDANTIFLGTDLGVWVSTNGGTNWKRFGTGLPNVVVYDMKLAANNTLIAGTHGRGMWISSSLLSSEDVTSPASLMLHQNYPNPFNPTTTISFSLDRPAYARLTLLDQQGRTLRSLSSGYRNAGVHQLELDAGSMSSGTYFYMLESGGKRLTKKLTVVK